MFIARSRFFLAALCLVLGLVVHYYNGFWDALPLELAAIVLFASHFLFGNVWPAFSQMKRGNIDLAEKLLSFTSNPNLLIKRNRAYYYFTRGVLDLQQKALEPAGEALKKAVELGLRQPNDLALANLNLAHIKFVQQELQEAKYYMDEVKKLQPTDLLIKQNLEKMEQALQARP